CLNSRSSKHWVTVRPGFPSVVGEGKQRTVKSVGIQWNDHTRAKKDRFVLRLPSYPACERVPQFCRSLRSIRSDSSTTDHIFPFCQAVEFPFVGVPLCTPSRMLFGGDLR